VSKTQKLQQFLAKQEADEALIDLIPSLEELLPAGVSFDMETWDLLPWVTRKGNAKSYNIYFDKITHETLKILIRIYFLDKRQSKHVSATTIKTELAALRFLDQAIGSRAINTISNATFEDAQALIVAKIKKSAAPRTVSYIETFGIWLNANIGYRISFCNTLQSIYLHGRKATDKDRDNKLIDFRIIEDLIACVHNEDLSDKDQFYLRILVLFVGTGFRINELATLPKECLIQENGKIGIRYYPEKQPILGTRWPSPSWAPSVLDAVKKLTELTNDGREVVAALRKDPGLDWSKIVCDEQAAQYFVGKFCHEWTSNPQNHMFSKAGAWLEKEKRYIDVIALVKKTGSQAKAAKQLGLSRSTIAFLLEAQQAAKNNKLPPMARGCGKNERRSWDTDSRVISILQLENHINLKLRTEYRKYFVSIIEDARDNYQLKGKVYPCPGYNDKLEQQFKRIIHPVITSKTGLPLLQPEDALLITIRYQLIESRETKFNDCKLITAGDISRWFCGEIRSLGTKNPEDSCFSRLGINDPKTGETARFTPHDIRHWLTTYLLEGGMPNDQVALLFNRTPNQNDTYDQTSSKTRLNNMRQAIRDGGAIGHVADMYHSIAEYSREEAEQYLEGSTLQLNLMPHGGCSLNWGMKACQNHNGCFNGENGLCENLCIDVENPETKIELHRMLRETKIALSVIPEQSPQYNHFQNTQRNLNELCEVSE
jgi:integrase/molybdenum-dependent DNA-binding transcriptional regulator ModE